MLLGGFSSLFLKRHLMWQMVMHIKYMCGFQIGVPASLMWYVEVYAIV